jgi:hypothetical protein
LVAIGETSWKLNEGLEDVGRDAVHAEGIEGRFSNGEGDFVGAGGGIDPLRGVVEGDRDGVAGEGGTVVVDDKLIGTFDALNGGRFRLQP